MAAAAILKIVKWPYLSRGLSDFDEIWHGDALTQFGPRDCLASYRDVKKSKTRRYSNNLKITIGCSTV